MDWFLYDIGLRHEKVKLINGNLETILKSSTKLNIFLTYLRPMLPFYTPWSISYDLAKFLNGPESFNSTDTFLHIW